MKKPTTVVGTRITAEQRAALDWLAEHRDVTISALIDEYGTLDAVALSLKLQAASDE